MTKYNGITGNNGKYSILLLVLIVMTTVKVLGVRHEVEKNGNQLKDKTICTIGDSISYHDKKSLLEEGVTTVGYQSILESKLGIKEIINMSISGAPISEGTRNGMGLPQSITQEDYTELIKGAHENKSTDLKDIQLVIIAGGTNDFRLDVPIGDIEELNKPNKDMYTFYGAYGNLVEKIIDSNKDTKIQLWTPLKRDNANYSVYSTNKKGHYLKDYQIAIINIAEHYKLTYCDMYKDSGLEMENLDLLTVDGLHPNNKGYEVISETAEKCLNKIKWSD